MIDFQVEKHQQHPQLLPPSPTGALQSSWLACVVITALPLSVWHVLQLYRERQELSEKLEAAMRSNSSCSGIKQQHPAALSTLDTAAAAPQPPLSSPTGLKLDQRATSQLIWTSSSCPSSLEGQGTGELSAQQGGERWGRSQDVRDAQCGSSGSSDTTGQPAVACDTGGCSESYNTAQSQLLDMSYISPLRGASSGDNALGRKIIRDDTPCSRAPASCAADSALASATEGAGTAASTGAVDAGTPLSAQSLSAFSAAKGPMPSPHMRDELQALSPLRRCGLPRATSHASAAAATSSGCSSAGSSGSSASRTTTGALADLLTPVGSGQQQQQTPVALSSAAVGSVPPGTACSRLTPKGSPLSAGCGFGSSVSVASSSKAGSVGPGLTLQPEFRLAAADALRPSPGAARDSSVLGIAAAGSAVSSHRLWLPEEQEGVGEAGELEGAAAALEGLYPRTLSQDFETGCLQDADDSCSSINDNEDDMMQAMHLGRKRQTGAGGELKRRSRGRAVLHGMLWVGVSVAAAGAGGAAAWRHKHAEVLQLMSLVRGGAAAAAGHAQQCVADGLRHVRHQTSRERSSNSSGHGSSMDTGEVAVAAS